jgi:hypothetical protein
VVLIGLHDRLVHNLCKNSKSATPSSQPPHPKTASLALPTKKTHLLQLLILQIAPDHHLQHNEQLAIANVPVAINIVHLESEPQLLFLVAFAAESAESRHEFLEIDVAAAVFVEDGDHACCERVRGDLRELQEFFALDCAGAVLVMWLVWCGLFPGGREV